LKGLIGDSAAAICSPPGAWIGAGLTGRLPTETLVHAIGAIVLLAALMMFAQLAF